MLAYDKVKSCCCWMWKRVANFGWAENWDKKLTILKVACKYRQVGFKRFPDESQSNIESEHQKKLETFPPGFWQKSLLPTLSPWVGMESEFQGGPHIALNHFGRNSQSSLVQQAHTTNIDGIQELWYFCRCLKGEHGRGYGAYFRPLGPNCRTPLGHNCPVWQSFHPEFISVSLINIFKCSILEVQHLAYLTHSLKCGGEGVESFNLKHIGFEKQVMEGFELAT